MPGHRFGEMLSKITDYRGDTKSVNIGRGDKASYFNVTRVASAASRHIEIQYSGK